MRDHHVTNTSNAIVLRSIVVCTHTLIEYTFGKTLDASHTKGEKLLAGVVISLTKKRQQVVEVVIVSIVIAHGLLPKGR